MTGYILTETAENDLREVLDYIAGQDGRERALHVHRKFVQAFEALAGAPGMGVQRELTPPGVRWWTVFRFLVIYQSEASPIEILRIIHGAREIRLLLEDT